MRVFITGGTGFIGSAVVNKLLKEGHLLLLLSRTPKNINNQNLKTINGSLDNILKWQGKLKKFKPDAAIHLAWEGLPNHNAHLSKLNLKYSLNLIKLLTSIGCKRLIVTGSGWEYGSQNGVLSEDTPYKLFDAFTAAKHAFYLLGQEIAKENCMVFIWTRLFYVYGPGQQPKALIPYLIRSIKLGQPPDIKNPKAKNDFIYVEDVAEALCEILEKCKKSNIYNIGSGKLTSISYIIRYIFNKFGIEDTYNIISKEPKDTAFNYSYADISKIKKEIGWKPKTSIEEGMQKTIDHHNNLQ